MTKRITTTVEMADGTLFEGIRVIPFDVVRLEREYSMSLAKVTGEQGPGLLMEHAMFLAWSALTRLKLWTGDLDEFMEQVAEVAEPEEQESPSPPGP
jgi:hypothetical protein